MVLVSTRAILITVLRRTFRSNNEFLKLEQKPVCAKLVLPQIQTRLYYAEKKVYNREKPHINIGTIGHAGHGKTTLTSAITKVLSGKDLAGYNEIDNAPEEKARGITMNVAHVEYQTYNRHYGHIDCPGHADYIKNMITGTGQMDGAILVVAATDSVMPETREHLILSKHIGIEHVVIFINKVDVADAEMIRLVEIQTRKLLTKLGYDNDKVPIVKGSALCALQGKNNEIGSDAIMELLNKVDNFIPTPVRDLDKPFLLPVEGAYSISGRGTVVTGRLERGIIKKGMECEFVGINKPFKGVITGIEMFHQTLTEAHAGDQLGVLIGDVKRDEVKRGMIMCKPGSTKAHDNIDAHIHVLKPEEGGRKEPIFNSEQLQIFSQTWNCLAEVTIPEKNLAMPGENVNIQLKMIKPMAIEKEHRFILRDRSTTLGTGVVSSVLKNLNKKEHLEKNKKRDKKYKYKIGANQKKNKSNDDKSKKTWFEVENIESKRFWLDIFRMIGTLLIAMWYLIYNNYKLENKIPMDVDFHKHSIDKMVKEMEEFDEQKQIKKKLLEVDLQIKEEQLKELRLNNLMKEKQLNKPVSWFKSWFKFLF